ncbi:MAG: PIN domain-containing protein [Thermoleophilia bacterium]
MAVVVDTSALYAYFDSSARTHLEVQALIEAERSSLMVTTGVLIELDHLLRRRVNAHTARRVMDELTNGAYELIECSREDLRRALTIIDRFSDRGLSLTDASLLELADRKRASTIFTLDRRDFAGLVRSDGTPLTILP